MDNIFMPLLDNNNQIKNNQVKNNIYIDCLMKPNINIITGPNQSGKSTFMRTIILNIYLSQSLGISPSDKTALTPFCEIFTYLNVPDAVGRESLFEAEMNRCFEYVNKTEIANGFTIGIIDELFTGTNPKEGMASSYAIIKKLMDNPTNITFLSTHYIDMIDYLKTNNMKDLSFYKFEAKLLDNKYIFDYKLKNGISNQHIAIELMDKRGFDKEIINNALNYLNNESKSIK
jgi:DNA mismatch repair ATPase MutS